MKECEQKEAHAPIHLHPQRACPDHPERTAELSDHPPSQTKNSRGLISATSFWE